MTARIIPVGQMIWTSVSKPITAGNPVQNIRGTAEVTLVYYEEFQGKQEAMKREYAIKQLTRKEKENLIKEKNMQQKGSQDTKRGSEQNQNL